MTVTRQLQSRSAAIYAAATLVAAGYCVLQSLSTLPLALGVAALSVVSAAALGYGLGAWYRPVGSERPGFELLAVPVIVFLGAPWMGASVFLLAGSAFSPDGAGHNPLWAVPGGIAMTLAYLSATWPVSLAALAAAGLAMARLSRPTDRVGSGQGPGAHPDPL